MNMNNRIPVDRDLLQMLKDNSKKSNAELSVELGKSNTYIGKLLRGAVNTIEKTEWDYLVNKYGNGIIDDTKNENEPKNKPEKKVEESITKDTKVKEKSEPIESPESPVIKVDNVKNNETKNDQICDRLFEDVKEKILEEKKNKVNNNNSVITDYEKTEKKFKEIQEEIRKNKTKQTKQTKIEELVDEKIKDYIRGDNVTEALNTIKREVAKVIYLSVYKAVKDAWEDAPSFIDEYDDLL